MSSLVEVRGLYLWSVISAENCQRSESCNKKFVEDDARLSLWNVGNKKARLPLTPPSPNRLDHLAISTCKSQPWTPLKQQTTWSIIRSFNFAEILRVMHVETVKRGTSD